MDMTLKQIFDCAMGKNIPAEFANENIDYRAALRDEIKKVAGTYNLYRRNKYDVFELLQENAEEVLPSRVLDMIGAFADVRTVGQNDRIVYTVKRGRQRGKQYVTRATAAGVYETFRLDRDTFEVTPECIGGAGIVDFERFLDGTEDIMDIYDIILEGMLDRIFEAVAGALLASWNDAGRPAANKKSVNGFNEATMAQLVSTVSAYGRPVIYCDMQFAAQMANTLTVGTNVKMSDEDIADIRRQGYIGTFHGTPVVVLPNSFVDEENAKQVFNPRFAFVIPAGDEKIVKVSLVGETIMKDVENEDWSVEVQAYKKFGVAVLSRPNWWGMYYNSAIANPGFDDSWMVTEDDD